MYVYIYEDTYTQFTQWPPCFIVGPIIIIIIIVIRIFVLHLPDIKVIHITMQYIYIVKLSPSNWENFSVYITKSSKHFPQIICCCLYSVLSLLLFSLLKQKWRCIVKSFGINSVHITIDDVYFRLFCCICFWETAREKALFFCLVSVAILYKMAHIFHFVSPSR